MKEIPLNSKDYEDVVSGKKWTTYGQSAKYSLDEGEEFLLTFGPGVPPIKAVHLGLMSRRFGSLSKTYQKELHLYYPDLTSGDLVYMYAWEVNAREVTTDG